ARGEERTRLVDGEGATVAPVADLRALADEDAVFRQRVADRHAVCRLDLGLRPSPPRLVLECRQLRLARVPRAVVGRDALDEGAETLLRVADDAEVRLAVTADLLRVDVELDHLRAVCGADAHPRVVHHEEARAHREDGV